MKGKHSKPCLSEPIFFTQVDSSPICWIDANDYKRYHEALASAPGLGRSFYVNK